MTTLFIRFIIAFLFEFILAIIININVNVIAVINIIIIIIIIIITLIIIFKGFIIKLIIFYFDIIMLFAINALFNKS